jgi:hypothetical protein
MEEVKTTVVVAQKKIEKITQEELRERQEDLVKHI